MSSMTGRLVRTAVAEIAVAAPCRDRSRTAARAACRGPARGRSGRRSTCGARSPTTASTGSTGTTRPMRKVTSSRPEEGDGDGDEDPARRPAAQAGRARAAPFPVGRSSAMRAQPLVTCEEVVGVERRPDHAARRRSCAGACTSICWNMITKGDGLPLSRCSSSYIFRALGGVALEHRGIGLLGHLGMSQALRQASGLALASSELSGLRGEGVGVGVRVLIVRAPAGRCRCRGCGRGTWSASACRRRGSARS